jgi:hypothetical protein
MRIFFKRLTYAPFESMIAGLAIASSTVGIVKGSALTGDPLYKLLPNWAALMFLLAYMLSGIFLLLGLGFLRADIESAGLVIIGTAQIVRATATIYLLDLVNVIIPVIFAALILMACGVRIWTLIHAPRLERLDGGGTDG